MPDSYELTKLDPGSFEHLVNLLALRVLGAGHSSFGPGPDAGRDGYFEGEAPYPSGTDRWTGCWYIQSKFHKPHLSKDAQDWLVSQIQAEIKAFEDPASKRIWPDNWIVATNIDPSGSAMTGAYDRAKALVAKARPALAGRFHIWGGRKILDLLGLHPEVADFYRHFLTPGHIFTALFDHVTDSRAELETILRHLIVRQFTEQQYTKLEQAGSDADTRPGIHKLFVDLPFRANEHGVNGMILDYLVHTSCKCHRIDPKQTDSRESRVWRRHPSRSQVWLLKGGPGQGKSTACQYFCQVQRAALILQADCFSVVPQIKSLAEEVCAAARHRGHWPTVPRIPISIELREYAQWFGLKKKEEARGVLTYLATRLSAGVEQPVAVGTLRRALSSRSWFVVFDGLDEVPHDVKDNVALEVLHFLNDVVAESDADLLSVCTSRPQGYSGQLAELDGPVIDLVNLSPEQALKCAQPVLGLGRSEQEADGYYQILQSAMQSASVLELMTTPLQSHIMAVVVRDGGKPPERRWQLYSNFYQVIKRREANRDLPDKQLARLLREDTQLLKTVHNRLGFVLHARAETSQGAQTHLDRSEFRNLVESAVSQMIEGDVRATVEVLMDATANRLVLVNTPDDGNHVRFDIRPLQEFFAAEFLYESVSADQLRSRMELIGGDAHWREVVHFLLSALVENGRHTELTVAVEVLERLNDGNTEGHERLLCRRLGRGALLANRLLQEGVLEQDKRVRQQFRKCLEPITAFVDNAVLHSSAEIRQPNSRSWYLSFLVESIRENDRTESVGASILLTCALEGNDPRVAEVESFILNSPPDYLATVLESQIADDWRREPRGVYWRDVPRWDGWIRDTALKAILGPRWQLLGERAVSAVCRILRAGGKEGQPDTRQTSLSRTEAELLGVLLASETTFSVEPERLTRDFGFITAVAPSMDWMGSDLGAQSLCLELAHESDQVRGLLQLIQRIITFAANRTQADLNAVLELVDAENADIIFALPSGVRACFPLDDTIDGREHVRTLRRLTRDEFQTMVTEFRIGSRPLHRPCSGLRLHPDKTCDLAQWRGLVREMPAIALFLGSDYAWDRGDSGKSNIFNTASAVGALVDVLLECPAILRKYAHLWGRLLEKAPDRSNELRRTLQGLSTEIDTPGFHGPREFHSFSLNMPMESCLLPHLVAALVNTHEDWVGQKEPEEVLGAVGHHVEILVSNAVDLERVIGDCEADSRIRAAACILTFLHPSGGIANGKYADLLVGLYHAGIGKWYFKSIVFCISLLGSETDDWARTLVGKVFDVARSDYVGRVELQRLLARWRETSSAPVSSVGVLEKWLRGE
jgi:hypothetical protein